MRRFITFWLLFLFGLLLGAGVSTAQHLGLILSFVGVAGLAALTLCAILPFIK